MTTREKTACIILAHLVGAVLLIALLAVHAVVDDARGGPTVERVEPIPWWTYRDDCGPILDQIVCYDLPSLVAVPEVPREPIEDKIPGRVR